MKVLVTGSRGFIGRHLVNALLEDDKVNHVVGIGRHNGDKLEKIGLALTTKHTEFNADILSPIDIALICETYRPDVIFHFAAIPTTQMDESFPTNITQTNIIGTQNLLHYALTNTRFVYASSITVYGNNDKPSEEYFPLAPTSVYAATKAAGEALVSAYTKQGRVNGISLRFVATVGKGATHGVLPDVIRKLKKDTETIDLLGSNPGTVKPYMHVKQAVDIAVHLGLHHTTNKTFNVAPSDNLSIAELAYCAMRKLNVFKQINWLGEKSIWPGDNKLIQATNYRLLLEYNKPIKSSNQAVFEAAGEV